MLYPISKIEVLEKMNTLDAIYGKESGRKWHELRRWLDQKAAEQSVHLTGGSRVVGEANSENYVLWQNGDLPEEPASR